MPIINVILLPIVSSMPPNSYIFYLNNLACSGGDGSFIDYMYYNYTFWNCYKSTGSLKYVGYLSIPPKHFEFTL